MEAVLMPVEGKRNEMPWAMESCAALLKKGKLVIQVNTKKSTNLGVLLENALNQCVVVREVNGKARIQSLSLAQEVRDFSRVAEYGYYQASDR